MVTAVIARCTSSFGDDSGGFAEDFWSDAIGLRSLNKLRGGLPEVKDAVQLLTMRPSRYTLADPEVPSRMVYPSLD